MISMDLPPHTATMASSEGDPLKGERQEAVAALVKTPSIETAGAGKPIFVIRLVQQILKLL